MIEAQFKRMRAAVANRWRYLLSCWRWREQVAELLQQVEQAPLSNERAERHIHELEIALSAALAKAESLPALEQARREAEQDRLEALRVKQESEIALEATEQQLAEAKARSEADQRIREAAEDKSHRLECELKHWKEEHRKSHETVGEKDRHVKNLVRFVMTAHRLDHEAPNGSILEQLREAQSR